jgi:hypothetical protein
MGSGHCSEFSSFKTISYSGIGVFKALREHEFYKFLNNYFGRDDDSSKKLQENSYQTENFIIIKIMNLKFGFASLILGALMTIIILLLKILIYCRKK